jgi:methyl-accepting chemotaxis protein
MLASAVGLTSVAAWWQLKSETTRSIAVRSEIGLRIAARTMSTLSSSYSPVYDDVGIVLRIETDKIRDRLNGTVVDQIGRTNNSPVFLFKADPNGEALTPLAGSAGNGSSSEEAQPVTGPAFEAIASGHPFEGIVPMATGPHYVGAIPIVGTEQTTIGAVLIDLGSVGNVEAGLRMLGLKLLASGAVVLVLGALCGAWFIRRAITRPIRAMTAAMSALADGDLAISVPEATRTDEIGAMAKAVQVFKENAREMAALRENEKTAAARADAERQEAMQRIADTFESAVKDMIADVAGSADEMETTARSLLLTAQEGNLQASSVSSATEQTSANVQSVASAVEELSSSIDAITREVAEAAAVSLTASEHAFRTDATVQALSEAAERIGEIVHLIGDIASHTNLLALNATIEAARAGEAGRGFAVVADEVRSLATQTGRATKEIGAQIEAVQAETRNAAMAVAGIRSVIEQVRGISASIASSVKHQGSTTQDIARNAHRAADGTREVSDSVGHVTQAAARTGAAAELVLTSAGRVSENAGRLRSEVEAFLETVRNR